MLFSSFVFLSLFLPLFHAFFRFDTVFLLLPFAGCIPK